MNGLTADQIAKRYANRPGCRLLGYHQVGISVFSMGVRVIVVEDSVLPPIDEFIVRTMGAGVTKPTDIAAFLGIERQVATYRLVELQRAELITVLPWQSDSDGDCALTTKGLEAAKSLQQRKHLEKTIGPVIYHGLLRKPIAVGIGSEMQLLEPKDLQAFGIEAIPAIPNRKPLPEEIDVELLDRLHTNFTKRRRLQRREKILNVRAVDKGTRQLYLPAVMLVYETTRGQHSKQVAFAIDGVLDDAVERAFAEKNGQERFKYIIDAEYETTDRIVAEYFPAEMAKRLPNLSVIDEATEQLDSAQQEAEAVGHAFQSPIGKPDTKSMLREELAEAHRRREAAEKRIEELKVRRLHLYSLGEVFDEAVTTAQKRLVIVSAFISSAVVNDSLIRKLSDALGRGVTLWIQYGMGDEERERRREWTEAADSLKKLRRTYPQLVRLDPRGKTHEKILICDDRFVAVGSYNWLSYPGSRAQQKRKEAAVQLFDKSQVDDWFEFVTSRFTSTE